jgi:ATP-binding cassette, subfamily B, bacterial MsbA
MEFGRVLLIATRRRWSIVGIILSSIFVAILWGANIGTLYPLVEVVFKGDSLPAYVDKEIVSTDAEIAKYAQDIQRLNLETAAALPDDAHRIRLKVQSTEAAQNAAVKSADTLRWVQPYIHRYCPDGVYETLLLIVALLIGGTAIKLVALTVNLLLVQYVTEKTAVDLRALFFRKALHLDLDCFGDNGSAALTSRLTNDIAHVIGGISVLLGRLVREPLKMAVCVAGSMYYCWRLFLLIMVIMPIVAMMTHILSRSIRRLSRKVMEEMSQLYGLLNDAFAGIRVVKAFNTQGFERARFNRGSQAYYKKSMKLSLYNTLARGTSELVGITVVGLAILAGGYLVVKQKTDLFGLPMTNRPLSVNEVLMFFAFLIGASDPARKLADVWSGLQRGIAASSRVFEIIDQEPRVREPEHPLTTSRPHARIRFEKVSFQYPSGPQVLREIDLTIRHGETLALVGPNGCGKSTLISLLCRFDEPQSGSIYLDDVPIDQMGTRDLRKRIALVTQRTTLFDDTIAGNIRYGSPGADDHAVVRAAKMAFADDFIRRKMPNGYQTLLGTAGMRLSGGQMQRIALARAFLRNPDILILDEATSQIDLESEHLIHEALGKFLVDRTGIMITHRVSSIALADRILVIENGQVADGGRHSELIGRNSFYQSLCGEIKMTA